MSEAYQKSQSYAVRGEHLEVSPDLKGDDSRKSARRLDEFSCSFQGRLTDVAEKRPPINNAPKVLGMSTDSMVWDGVLKGKSLGFKGAEGCR